MNIQELKAKYVVGAPKSGADCDLGGALCLEMTPIRDREGLRSILAYPTFNILSEYLAIANTQCGEIQIIEYARAICTLGDEGKWDEAWTELDRALTDKG